MQFHWKKNDQSSLFYNSKLLFKSASNYQQVKTSHLELAEAVVVVRLLTDGWHVQAVQGDDEVVPGMYVRIDDRRRVDDELKGIIAIDWDL